LSPRPAPPKLFDRIRALVFDFDGTLADSARIWEIVNSQFFAKRGIPHDPGFQDAIAGFNVVECARYVKERYGIADHVDDIIAEWEETYLKLYATDLDYIQGAVDFIRAMRERGLKIGIATAADMQALGAYFSAHEDTRGLFDVIVTTTDVGRPKPDPAVYLECMHRLGASPDTCVIFEDTVTGLQGAKATGSRVVCIHSTDTNLPQKQELSDCIVVNYIPLLQSVSHEVGP